MFHIPLFLCLKDSLKNVRLCYIKWGFTTVLRMVLKMSYMRSADLRLCYCLVRIPQPGKHLRTCKWLFVYWLNILSMPFPIAHKHVSRQYQDWFLINHTSRASLPLGTFWGLFTLYTPDQTKHIYFLYIYFSKHHK